MYCSISQCTPLSSPERDKYWSNAQTLFLKLSAYLSESVSVCSSSFVAAAFVSPTEGPAGHAAYPVIVKLCYDVLNLTMCIQTFPFVINFNNLHTLQAFHNCLLWSLSRSLNSLDEVIRKGSLTRRKTFRVLYPLCERRSKCQTVVLLILFFFSIVAGKSNFTIMRCAIKKELQ